jgi:tetratricopeptide (TPR) repeat protein
LPKTVDAVDALKRRYEEKVAAARNRQTQKYSEAGAAAVARKDWVAAANAYRVALSFDESNDELKTAYDGAQLEADKLLADQYLSQAQYEEKSERWAEAAKSWQRVARARESDVRAHERAAHCLVKADGNLHEAAALALKATQLAPKDAKIRLTLANVYLAAGLSKNARRELETAAQLAPDDPNVATLLKRVSK